MSAYFVWQSTVVVGVIDNLLNRVNLAGFGDLQAEAPAGQSVLNNAERYALYLATALSQNTSEQGILLSRGNIGEATVQFVWDFCYQRACVKYTIPNFPPCFASFSFWENHCDQQNTTNRCNISTGRGLRKLHNEQWLASCRDHYSGSADSGKIKL